jgi:hypothetical protein
VVARLVLLLLLLLLQPPCLLLLQADSEVGGQVTWLVALLLALAFGFGTPEVGKVGTADLVPVVVVVVALAALVAAVDVVDVPGTVEVATVLTETAVNETTAAVSTEEAEAAG